MRIKEQKTLCVYNAFIQLSVKQKYKENATAWVYKFDQLIKTRNIQALKWIIEL